MASTLKPKFEGVSDRLIRFLSPIARDGNGVRWTLSADEVRLLLRWLRTMRRVERAGIDHVTANQARKAARERRGMERDAFWTGVCERINDLLLAYALTGVSLWIVEAFWMAGGR